ncbi:MAG: hypothetical protein JO122_20630 [Acetobacteraceae bacterium]|nr:hypothetical protein [Acetobacteraceae bacterium]
MTECAALVHFAHIERQNVGVSVDHIPCVSMQLMFDPVDESGRAVQSYRFRPSQQQTEQVIEASCIPSFAG